MTFSRTGALVALGTSALLVTGCGSSTTTPTTTRAVTDLTAALLTTAELPRGSTVTPGSDNVGPTIPASASQPCKDLGAIVFAAITPGSLSHAKADFKAAGAAGSEEIDSMGTQAAAEKLADDFKAAATGCPTLTGVSDGTTLTFGLSVGPGQNGGAHDVSYVLTGKGAAAGHTLYGEVAVIQDVFLESDMSDGGTASEAAGVNKLAVARAKTTLKLQ